MKIVMVVMLLAVLGALATAGMFMLRQRKDGEPQDPQGRQMARALAVRVALSVALFLFMLLGWHLGWIRPGGLPTGT